MPSPAARDRTRVAHHFTVDVEEYFQVSALEPVVSRDDWPAYESRVVRSTETLLDMLDVHEARGTFFVLGWIADRHPGLVREIADRGHEVASHGWGHRRVTTLTPDRFRGSVRESKEVLEEVTGEAVVGYRAPSFSIVPGREWALDILVEEGYVYDSSLFPVRRRGYGYPTARRDPYPLARNGGHLMEFPPATLRAAGLRLPAAGGAYLRLLSYGLVAGALRQAEGRGAPGTFYLHPWELDPGQPRLDVSPTTRIRHYGGLRRMAGRVERLLAEFRFQSIAATLREMDPKLRFAPVPHG